MPNPVQAAEGVCGWQGNGALVAAQVSACVRRVYAASMLQA